MSDDAIVRELADAMLHARRRTSVDKWPDQAEINRRQEGVKAAAADLVGADDTRQRSMYGMGIIERFLLRIRNELPTYQTIGELDERIKAFERALRATSQAIDDLSAVRDVDAEGFGKIGRGSRLSYAYGLNFTAVVSLNGVGQSALEANQLFLKHVSEQLDELRKQRDRWVTRRGRPYNPRAYTAARLLAIAFVEARGELPSLSREQPDKPAHAFVASLKTIFDLLDIQHGSPERAAEWGIKQAEAVQISLRQRQLSFLDGGRTLFGGPPDEAM